MGKSLVSCFWTHGVHQTKTEPGLFCSIRMYVFHHEIDLLHGQAIPSTTHFIGSAAKVLKKQSVWQSNE